MKIYLDVLFLVNYVFDLVLLISVNYILRRGARLGRLLFGGLVGSLTMLLAFIDMGSVILFLFKLGVSFLMLIACFGFKDIRYFFKNVIYFYLVSMLMGGGIYFLNSQFNYSNNGLAFSISEEKVNYGFILALVFIIYYIFMKAFKALKNNYSNYHQGIIYFNDEDFILVNAFLDTGNKLRDPYSNKSIILVHEDLIGERSDNILYVPFNSLNNHGLLKCYKGKKIIIDGKENDNFLVGVSQENFFLDGINCIINTDVMEGLK